MTTKTPKTKKRAKYYNISKHIKKKERPVEDPDKYELNKFKTKKNNLFRVGLRNSKKVWRKATPKETKCYKYLQNRISYNLDKYKSKKSKYKTPKQAVAVSYIQAKQKYPECNL